VSISPRVRWWLGIQGFAGLDEIRLAQIEPWLRFTPALCTTLMGLGTALALPELLWALAPVAALGALFPVHAFDLIYNHLVRRLTGTGPLPPNGAPRRFACGVAALWLAATAGAFEAGLTPLGYALGGVLTAVAALVSTTHVCIPSLAYRLIMGGLARQ
jgi:hypothetical protein